MCSSNARATCRSPGLGRPGRSRNCWPGTGSDYNIHRHKLPQSCHTTFARHGDHGPYCRQPGQWFYRYPSRWILNVTGTGSCAVGALGNIAGSCIGDAATGSVTVDGAGATFTNAGNLGVGFNGGTGTLVISNGGTVTT